jgi:hypothetical protein
MEAQVVYRYLHLEQFSIQELEQRYDSIVATTTATSSKDGDLSDVDVSSSSSIFIKVHPNNDGLTEEMLQTYLEQTISTMEEETALKMKFSNESPEGSDLLWKQQFVSLQSQQLWNFLNQSNNNHNNDKKNSTISKQQFITRIQVSAKAVDFHRLWPLTLSMLMVGSTVGVTTPAMVRTCTIL